MLFKELSRDEERAGFLILEILKVRVKYKLTPSDANWILRGCGLLKAAKSLVRKVWSEDDKTENK